MSASREIAQGGLAGGADLPLGHQNPHRSPIRVDHLAVANLVFHPAQGMNAEGVAADAPFRRRLGQLGLGDQVAGGRIRSRERDAGGLADQAASAVAPDEIARPQRPAVTERDVDAGVVLCEARHLDAAIDGHRQFPDPPGEDALDMVLPQPEPVRVPGRKVADVQPDPREPGNLRLLPLGEEPIGDSALIEDLDGARVQTACARAGEVLAGAPLDNGNVDARQRQLACQHQAGRASSGDHHRMVGHRRTPVVSAAAINSAARDRPVDNNILILRPPRFWLRSPFLRDGRGLEASPLHATY